MNIMETTTLLYQRQKKLITWINSEGCFKLYIRADIYYVMNFYIIKTSIEVKLTKKERIIT
jgi:hypothetical protein